MDEFRTRQKQSGVRRVNVTLTSDEVLRINQSALSHGEKITSHLKTLAMAHLDERYLVPPDLAERLDALLSIMRGIGNNLNQLARHSNEMRYFLDTKEVQLHLKRLDEEVCRFVRSPPNAGQGPDHAAPAGT